MWQAWLIISGICLVIEIITVGFLVFWFAIGALITMIVSFFTDNIIIQATTFIVSSTALIFATKPLVNKITKNKNNLKTNVDSMSGKFGLVTEDIDTINGTGQVKVSGELWSAIGLNDMSISSGTEIEVLKVEGVKVIVTPLNVK